MARRTAGRPFCHSVLGAGRTTMSDAQRDHLFISYAWEDGAFAEWLALKLTAEGYGVWCDRFKLLGGESYPQDIDRAIREQTFRLLALMSHSSVNKPNPLKERTLALNLARQRKEDFVIPLNVDGLGPSEVGWMLSDLSYISFHRSWADGFAQLLKKLRSLDAPRPLAEDGRAAVTDWFAERETVSPVPERLWMNLLPIELEQHAAERIDVSPRITALASNLLRSHVIGRAAHIRKMPERHAACTEAQGNAEIGQLQLAILRDQDVLRLEVPMHDALCMDISQRVRQLHSDPHDLFDRQRVASPQIRPQRLAVD